ncbi:MAG: hypothetical protein OXB97_00355 [Rhodospirillales bacterium]|nr:hypothetical protein [Rhodospirillales bacterium]
MTGALDVAVVESRWWEEGNTSVRGLFEIIATIKRDNPDAYHYEMFNNAPSLKEIIHRVSKKEYIRNLYIAAHGWEDGICGAERKDRNGVSRTRLGNMLSNRSITGLYLSSCLTENADTVYFLLERSNVCWIAGYSEEASWLEGASIDLYSWASYYKANNTGGADGRIRRVARKMKNRMLPLCKQFGFNLFVRGDNGGVEPLLYDL